MQLPLTDPDTLFEELLQDLSSETAHMAREFKAFARARKVTTPELHKGTLATPICRIQTTSKLTLLVKLTVCLECAVQAACKNGGNTLGYARYPMSPWS